MPKEIIAKNPRTTVIYRFVGKEVFLKCSNMQYASQLINQIKQKGGHVKEGRGWLKCDLFGDHSFANLGPVQIDLSKEVDLEIEKKLCDFFSITLEKAKFKVEVKEI